MFFSCVSGVLMLCVRCVFFILRWLYVVIPFPVWCYFVVRMLFMRWVWFLRCVHVFAMLNYFHMCLCLCVCVLFSHCVVSVYVCLVVLRWVYALLCCCCCVWVSYVVCMLLTCVFIVILRCLYAILVLPEWFSYVLCMRFKLCVLLYYVVCVYVVFELR